MNSSIIFQKWELIFLLLRVIQKLYIHDRNDKWEEWDGWNKSFRTRVFECNGTTSTWNSSSRAKLTLLIVHNRQVVHVLGEIGSSDGWEMFALQVHSFRWTSERNNNPILRLFIDVHSQLSVQGNWNSTTPCPSARSPAKHPRLSNNAWSKIAEWKQ